jgi:hypothetical protein
MPAIAWTSVVHHTKHVAAAWSLHNSAGPRLAAGCCAHTQQPPTHKCQVKACSLPGSAGDMLSGMIQQNFDQMLLCQGISMILRVLLLPNCDKPPGCVCSCWWPGRHSGTLMPLCAARTDISWSSRGIIHFCRSKMGMQCSEAANLRELVVPPSVEWQLNGWCDEETGTRQQQ